MDTIPFNHIADNRLPMGASSPNFLGHLPAPPAGSPIPEGYLRNSFGHLVPMDKVKPQHLLEDQTVRDLVAGAEALRKQIAAFKVRAFADVRAYLQILDEKYGAKRGGGRGGVQLESFDGTLRVSISIADSITLGPELTSAKVLVDECINAWSGGANANLKALVDDAFRVGEGGKLAIDRILGLRRMEIHDDRWKRAMEAINDAIRIVGSREYLRVYVRPTADDNFEQLVLDFAKL